VATAALRPVEEMRRTATRISVDEPGARLPVPESKDELARLGSTLNALLARLEEALQRERRFVGDASHELRTPLAILRSQIDLALDSGRSPAELRAALESCGEEVDRLIRLSNDLLVLARADEGGAVLEREDSDVAALARRVAAEPIRAAATVSAPDRLVAPVDPTRVEQALGNLLDNALLHGAPPVSVEVLRRADHVELVVRDSGPGFDEDLRGRATERFSRGAEARSKPGSGLGLAIAEAIATAHGGSLRIASNGDGAEVALVLPASPPAQR
jgi:signal transduction histidine kinase